MNLLKTENLKKYYGSGESLVKALDGVNFSVEREEFVTVVGTSGSGKSTLLNMLGGLDTPTSGSVVIDGKELAGMTADEPTGNLDSKTGQEVLGLLKQTSEQFGQTLVMITHNLEIVQLADRIVRIEDGKMVKGGVVFLCGATLLSPFRRKEYSRQGEFYFGEYLIGISPDAEKTDGYGIADIRTQNPLNDELKTQLASLHGVKRVTVSERMELAYEYNGCKEDDCAVPFDRKETGILNRHSENGAVFDYDKMVMEREIIITGNDVAEEIFGWRFEPGDQVIFYWNDGEKECRDSFTIAGCVDELGIYRDKDDRGRRLEMGSGWFLMLRALMKNMVPETYGMYDKFGVSVEDGENNDGVRKWIKAITEKNPVLSYRTLSEEMKEDESAYLSLKYMIYGISAFLIVFAVINLVNTLVSDLMSRLSCPVPLECRKGSYCR